jgi:ABC-type nitrate/sulfonate/bicarbonate transport system ATPase subunit
VLLEGRDLTGISADRRAALGLARTFQNVALFRGMSVLDNIKLGGHTRLNTNPLTALWYRGPAQREEIALRHEIERDVIDFLEIDHIRHLPVAGLPYGLQKRVELARALAMRPKVLLMDEPFAALDVQTRAKMQDFLLDVWRDSGASVLFVTHHIDEAVALADRVVVFTARPGRIKTIIPIDLPRPRNPFSPECEKLRMQLTEEMRSEVDRAFAEQEALVPA